MKKNIRIIAVIFSVVLNLVFIGSFAYHRSEQSFFMNHHENRMSLIYEQLNLNQEQLDKVTPMRISFHAYVGQQGDINKQTQLELIDLLAKENIDRDAIDIKTKSIHELQQQMQRKVIDHLIEESSIFTAEQREKFFTIIKSRIAKSNNIRPPWMPQTSDTAKGDNRP